MTVVGTIATINRYPVKSMLGEQPDVVTVDADGIAGDRTWALRDIETGKLASAKLPRRWAPLLTCRATGTGDDVEVELPSGERYGIHDAALRVALEAHLGRTVSIEEASGPQQGVYESEWPEIDGLTLAGEMDFPTNITGEGSTFIDVGVLHVLTTTSLATLAAADPDIEVHQDRFRPSFLLETPDLTGFPENEWSGRTLRIGEGDDAVELTVGDPTPRCVMTTLAQGDLPRQPAVLRALATHNRLSNEMGTFACLGAYATVARPGEIRAGDRVELV